MRGYTYTITGRKAHRWAQNGAERLRLRHGNKAASLTAGGLSLPWA